MTPLILSADDFALHEGIDAAVLELAGAGRLTATSCLVLSPRWKEAARSLTHIAREQFDIGLHLDFSEFAATVPLRRLIYMCSLRRLDGRQVRTRVARQFDAFEDAVGTPPDYVDGHQHVHQLPQIREALVAEMTQRYASPPWIRISNPAAGHGFKGGVIRHLGARVLARQAAARGIPHTKRLFGVYGFDLSQRAFEERLWAWLRASQRGDALMLHPARHSPGDDPIGSSRNLEYAVLGSPWFAATLEQLRVRPVRGRELFDR